MGHNGKGADVANGRGIGRSALRRRQPISDEQGRAVFPIGADRPASSTSDRGICAAVRARESGRRRDGFEDAPPLACEVKATLRPRPSLSGSCLRIAIRASCGMSAGSAMRQSLAWSVSSAGEQAPSSAAAMRTIRRKAMRPFKPRVSALRGAAAWRDCRRLPFRTTAGGCSCCDHRTTSRKRGRRILGCGENRLR